MKICIILGTRPEIIKMSPIIRECQKRKIDFFILHTGQHYSPDMDEIFFKELNLPKPKYNLKVGSNPYNMQVGLMVNSMIPILIKEKPGIVLVQGDTISVLAGALAARRTDKYLAHHEAGLRSHDTRMMEETNRVVVDHLSHFLFAPTKDAIENLRQEGRGLGRVCLSGNTVVEAVEQNLKIASEKSKILQRLNLKEKDYILITAHRAENVDFPKPLAGIFEGLEKLSKKTQLKMIFPLHPRTKKRLQEFKIKIPKRIQFIDPVGFLDMLMLESRASLVITDSGGLQEESCTLRVPCVTIRDNTERPEAVAIGQSVLVGTNPDKIVKESLRMLKKKMDYKQNPFGDGSATRIILAALEKENKLYRKNKIKRTLKGISGAIFKAPVRNISSLFEKERESASI